MTQHGSHRLRMVRMFPAAPGVVFRALTDPVELSKWWGPDGFSIPRVESDLRPGGVYRIEMQPPEGESFFLTGEFLEVEPPALLSYTFCWEDPDPEDRETIVILELHDDGTGSTRLVFVQGGFATEGRLALHDEGWSQGFDKLEGLLRA
ncbi:SRPBCC family protein [Streptomyces sp. NBC_01233]|uniref:SRPBCC family protein n=1 Tax=Streptomyces sp. NBC_01233 TaxID=2903787 RepID=UPI002E0F318F|nr:SRPBCC domain-containing protein [Streptomyces sp. NBC_01233]